MSTKKKPVAAKNEQPITRSTFTPHLTQHTPVGEIGIEVVAGIAAHFPIEMDPPDAIRRAYQLLEYASAGRRGELSPDMHRDMDGDRISGYEAGISRLKAHQMGFAVMVEMMKRRLPPDLLLTLSDEVEAVPLDAVLRNLMPRHEIKDRLPTFTRWVIDCEIGHGDDEPFESLITEAEGLIDQWRKTGVPQSTYKMARLQFRGFLQELRHQKHVANGTAGAEAKKAKQGRAKKPTDKRTGPRLPGEKKPRAKKSR
jgi:hypothetical protein